jgi:hypothetical protein
MVEESEGEEEEEEEEEEVRALPTVEESEGEVDPSDPETEEEEEEPPRIEKEEEKEPPRIENKTQVFNMALKAMLADFVADKAKVWEVVGQYGETVKCKACGFLIVHVSGDPSAFGDASAITKIDWDRINEHLNTYRHKRELAIINSSSPPRPSWWPHRLEKGRGQPHKEDLVTALKAFTHLYEQKLVGWNPTEYRGVREEPFEVERAPVHSSRSSDSASSIGSAFEE